MIGVFDSGFGGLTILKEIQRELPGYDILYLGDNARAPYGPHTFDTIYRYTLEAVEYLFAQGCELVILACNTASAKALRTIQQNDLPRYNSNKRVLGILRPTVEALPLYTKSFKIGVMATQGTVLSNSYALECQKLFPEITVFQQACPMLVPLIENNEYQSEGARFFIKKYVDELLQQNSDIDTIVLGCTHYPLLQPTIKEFLPQHIQLLSQDELEAKSLKDYLNRHPEIEEKCPKNSNLNFQTTEIHPHSHLILEKLFGKATTIKKIQIC